MRSLSALPIAAIALSGSPAHAGDQGLQAALQRLSCLPARVRAIELATRMTAYEVACKGAERVVTVICLADDCRVQTRAKEEEP